jgi:hypothetical protein
MRNELRQLARRQDGVVAVWQLVAAGLSRDAAHHHTAGLQRLFDGVYVTGDGRITDRQRWIGAAVTAPHTLLAGPSAAAAYGIARWKGLHIVVRPGTGGPKRHGPLLVHHSTLVLSDGSLRDATTFDGIRITTAERTVAAVWPRLRTDRARHKLVREALRLRRTTVPRLRAHLDAAPSRNAPRKLIALLDRYERLQLHRCRSDAEAYAVELIDAAGLPLPQINVRIAGEEADLSWPDRRLVIEIDGDRFHQDKAEDARKTAIWTAARHRVRRAPADLVFGDPARFVAGVRGHLAAA